MRALAGNQEKAAESAIEQEPYCGIQSEDRYVCTLQKGHPGNHKAGNGEGTFYREWANPEPSLLQEAIGALKIAVPYVEQFVAGYCAQARGSEADRREEREKLAQIKAFLAKTAAPPAVNETPEAH